MQKDKGRKGHFVLEEHSVLVARVGLGRQQEMPEGLKQCCEKQPSECQESTHQQRF